MSRGTRGGMAQQPAVQDSEVLRRHVAAAGSLPAGIATACVELLFVDGAAVLLMADTERRWHVAASVGRWARELEEAQLTVAEGPAAEAYSRGGPVLLSDVTAQAARWPGFAAVVPAEVRALFSFPLQVGAVQFGVLDLYCCTPGGWDGLRLGTALNVVDCAAGVLISGVGSPPGDPLCWLDDLPGHTPEIDQAAGMASVQLGASLAVAYARLRGFAFASSQSLVAVAREVVAGHLRLVDDDPWWDGDVGQPPIRRG